MYATLDCMPMLYSCVCGINAPLSMLGTPLYTFGEI